MDESSARSGNLDQTEQDFLACEVSDEIIETAGGGTNSEPLNISRMTFGGWPSTTAACCGSV